MLRDFERVFNTDQRRLGLILNSMLADSKNSSLLSLIARFTCERRVWNLTFSDSDGCNLSFLRTVSFLDKIDIGTCEPGHGVIKPLFWLCHQEKVVPCTTSLCHSSISEHQKNLFSQVAWLLWKTLTSTFLCKNSLVWQNSQPGYFESLDLVLALDSEQITLQSNLAYK